MRTRCIVVICGLALALPFTVGTSLADVKCLPVVAHGALLEVSEECGIYDLCVFGWVKGTLNGDIETYVTEPYSTLVDQNRAEVQWGDDVFLTNKGELYTRWRAVFDVTGVSAVSVETITGGTGAYEGATGELILWLGPDEKLQIRGEICTPKERPDKSKVNPGRVRRGGT